MLNKLSLNLFSLFIVADILSALAYYLPHLRNFIFVGLIFLALILILRHLEYGLALIFAELFVGSKGYLFSFSVGETLISIRIALFIIFFSIFFSKLLFKFFSHTPVYRSREDHRNRQTVLNVTIVFLVMILFGILNGLWRGYDFGSVFLDANGYFFVFLIFPVLYMVEELETRTWLKEKLSLILLSGALWLAIKTIILFVLFVHLQNASFLSQIYLWVRNTIGEITPAGNGLYRIFIQSQLYIVLAYFLILNNYPKFVFKYSSIFLTAILISLSRSFWLGLLAAYSSQLIIYSFKKKWSNARQLFIKGLLSVAGAIIILSIIYLPSLGGVGERTKNLIGEPAVSSRLAQFKPLVTEILKSPILGHGFGKTVTYKTSDPRILQFSPSGNYTTYAFELGYLDILLKVGLLGLAIYLFLIYKIWKNMRVTGFKLGLIALLVINIFSPYLNHPLGIGYLLLMVIARSNTDEAISSQSKMAPTISG